MFGKDWRSGFASNGVRSEFSAACSQQIFLNTSKFLLKLCRINGKLYMNLNAIFHCFVTFGNANVERWNMLLRGGRGLVYNILLNYN